MLEGLGGSASTLPLFAVRAPRTNDFHAGFAANEERRADGRADRAPHRPARACPLYLACRPPRSSHARGLGPDRADHRQGDHASGADRLQGRGRSPDRRGDGQGDHRGGPRREPGVPHRRLWRRQGDDGGVRPVPRCLVHRRRAERGAQARQPHLQPSPCALLALSPGAADGRVEPRHRARRHRRRHHRAHGRAQFHSDRRRAPDDLRPDRLLFRLDLCGGRAGDGGALCRLHLLGERAAHRHPPRHERFRHRGARQGRRQPAQLRDGEIFRQRGARGAPLRRVHGALRESGDPHLHLARLAERRAGGDLHAWNGDLHAARGARRRRRHAHHRRIRDDQRHPDAALSAAQFHGHGVSRDQARA